MAKKKSKRKVARRVSKKRATTAPSRRKSGMGMAILALLLNILILPGLGSLIGGKSKEGIWQIVLAIIGIILSIITIGVPILIAAWIWGIVTGIKIVQEAR